MKTYRKNGVVFSKDCPDEIRRLEVVAKSWISECERFETALDDAPWWYNERANISIFSTAASRIDWIALEEYGTEKIVKNDTKSERKEKKNGRCDLYLYDCVSRGSKNKNASDYSYAIEAKQTWPAMTGKSNTGERVEKKWKEAISAARELHRLEADNRVAVLFIVPYTKNAINLEQRMALLSRCEQLENVHAIAWYWTKNEVNEIAHNKSSRNYFPGVLLAFRLILKGN